MDNQISIVVLVPQKSKKNEVRENFLRTKYASKKTKYAVRSTQYAVRSTQYAVRSTQYAVRSTQYAVRSTQYGVVRSTKYIFFL